MPPNQRARLYQLAKKLAAKLGIRAPIYKFATIIILKRFIRKHTAKDIIRYRYTLAETNGDTLYDALNPLMRPNRHYYISFSSDGVAIRIIRVTTLKKNEPKHDWYNLFNILRNILSSFDEYRTNPDYIDIILHAHVLENPQLINMRNGSMNCACKAVLEAVLSIKRDKNTDTINKHIMILNEQYLKKGIDELGLQQLADKTRYDLVIYDKSKRIWATFDGKHKKTKKLLMIAHDNHLALTTDFTNPTISFLDNLKLSQIDCVWVDQVAQINDYGKKFAQENVESKPLYSKAQLVALITPELVVKLRFPECEQYPDCFTEGGVGKAKFIEAHPEHKQGMARSNPFYDLLLEADVSGFYMRIQDSKPTNSKYDMNKAYRSFRSTGLFTGFPNISAIFTIAAMYSDFRSESSKYGLVYVENDYNALTLEAFTNRKQIYYEVSGWVPIELVEANFRIHGVNPYIKQYLYAATTWDTKSFDAMTNHQFRCFIGKCVSQSFSERWQTSDKVEFMRARYILKDRILSFETRRITVDNCEQTSYIIDYTSEQTPWNLPIVSVYVKAHQKHNLFTQINKLHRANIKIISISVDSIETKRRCDELFDLGTEPGRWKKEILTIRCTNNFLIDRYKHSLYKKDCLNWSEFKQVGILDLLPRTQFIHISGAGGNGKSELICNMGKSFLRAQYSATTNEAVKNLSDRLARLSLPNALTMHKVFGLSCSNEYMRVPLHDYDIIYIDEASMISNEQLSDITSKIRPHQTLILSGDFWQLPCVNGTPIFNVGTGIGSPEYSRFALLDLTKNYRQALDPDFYALCSRLRRPLSIQEALEIIEKLNTRVQPTIDPADYSSIHSIYIAGRNKNVDAINDNFTWQIGTKVICNAHTQDIAGETIPNNQIGVITELTDQVFKLQWANGSTSTFKLAKKSKFSIGMANTVHKAQGKTMLNNVVIAPGSLFEKHHLYVALTRATQFKSIILTQPITMRILRATCYVF